MRKHFRKIAIIITAVLFVLPILLIAVSCKSVEPRSVAEVIPASLGEAEGLWLYKGNTRTRTDGTEEEALLTSITVDETEYGEEDFKIIRYKYVRGTFEIFYIVQIEKDIRLYHYNYFTKASSDLYDLPDVENPSEYSIQVSNSLVYVSNKNYGVVFSRTAQLLYENFHGTLDGEIVYRIAGNDFEYYIKDGEKHVVSLGGFVNQNDFVKNGKYAYIFGSSVIAVNLETGEKATLSAFETESGNFHGADSYVTGGSLYVLANCIRNRDTDDEERLYRFIRIKGTQTETIYDFGDVPYDVEMLVDGSTIYLVKNARYARKTKYYSYDSKTGETDTVSKKTAKQGKSTDALKREQAEKTEEITVGGYTFFVTSIGYDDRGVFYDKTCYYLMRKCGDLEEVMQYSLDMNRGYFYDDICEL